MNPAILTACIGGVGMIVTLAVGWHFGVKTAFVTMKSIARQHLNDADYGEFVRLLGKVTEAGQ
jgi:hypothetical protein